jgi:Zn-dependent protease
LNILLFIPGFLLGIVFHEAAHAWMANKLGDPTARMLGRLSLNPMKHIDPMGTVLMPLMLLFFSGGRMVFGYARPTPITGENFKNPRLDHLWVALAGPGANVLVAILLILAGWGGRYMGWLDNSGLRRVLEAGLNINIMLAAFNLIPLPPLDGSEILTAVLPGPWAYRYQRLAPYSFLILTGLFFTGLFRVFMVPISMFIQLLLAPFGNPF